MTGLQSPRHPAGTTEVLPEALFAFGGGYPLDGRVSWAPRIPGAFQPTNCYLLRRPDGDTVVVDPGLKFVGPAVLSGLASVVDADATLKVVVTRPQFDCVGNIGAIFGAFPNSRICAKDLQSNYFDCFDELLEATQDGAARRTIVMSPEASGLELLSPSLHLLRTTWAYDAHTKTLFTSDSFSHGILDDPGARPVIDDLNTDTTTPKDVAAHLFATNPWMPSAEVGSIGKDLVAIFSRYDVEVVAPDRGCVLVGRDVIGHHVAMLVDAIGSARSAA